MSTPDIQVDNFAMKPDFINALDDVAKTFSLSFIDSSGKFIRNPQTATPELTLPNFAYDALSDEDLEPDVSSKPEISFHHIKPTITPFFEESQVTQLRNASTEYFKNAPVTVQKMGNISPFINCQNCETHFPTKYQFQRHQCEFNAEKIVLKPDVDAKDVERGVRIKFDCPTCGKLFVSKNNLERHITSHNEDNINICEHCNKQFISENRLRIHKENHCKKSGDISKFYRSDVKVYKCLKCSQVFSSNTFANNHAESCSEIYDQNEVNKVLAHQEPVNVDNNENSLGLNPSRFTQMIVTEILLQCEFCNKTFADKESLLNHQQHTHTTKINYKCVSCDETFDSYVTATKHWLTKCTNDANLFFLPKLTYCQVCERTFKSHEMLYTHKIKQKHYTIKRHELVEGNNKEVVASIINQPEKKNIYTIIAGAKSNLEEAVMVDETGSDMEHEDLKEENASIENEILGFPESEPSDYDAANGKKKRGRKRKHMHAIDTLTSSVYPNSEYRYQCEQCILVFDNPRNLELHREKDHPANYKCEECDQVLQSSKALIIHSRAHKKLKPYVCDICKRAYSQTSHLWQHMRFHQGIKPFACPHQGCEARYTIRPDLKDHIRKVHTRERPFKCTVCNKSFLTGSVFYQHRLIHTNDRRYSCLVCHKKFFRADALNNHKRIHTDERPYPCEVCNRGFRQKGDRNKHMRTQHATATV